MDKTVLNLENQIATFIGSDNKNNCTVHFEYSMGFQGGGKDDENIVSCLTVNPVTEETFLLKSETAGSKEKALKKILEYVKKQKGESPFSVLWTKKGEGSKMNMSHFYCHDIKDVVELFFHGKNSEDYIVYEIKLNPIS